MVACVWVIVCLVIIAVCVTEYTRQIFLIIRVCFNVQVHVNGWRYAFCMSNLVKSTRRRGGGCGKKERGEERKKEMRDRERTGTEKKNTKQRKNEDRRQEIQTKGKYGNNV